MAEVNQQALDDLLTEMSSESKTIQSVFPGLGNGLPSTKLKQLSTKKPPSMTWVLVGIPTVHFGEISTLVSELSCRNDVVIEMTSNDGPKN